MLDSIVQNDNYYFVESSKMFVRLWLLFLIRESRSFIARRIRQEGVELSFFTSIMDYYQKDVWCPAYQIISCKACNNIDHGLLSQGRLMSPSMVAHTNLLDVAAARSLVDVTAEWMRRWILRRMCQWNG
jgi:hypothetical protein